MIGVGVNSDAGLVSGIASDGNRKFEAIPSPDTPLTMPPCSDETDAAPKEMPPVDDSPVPIALDFGFPIVKAPEDRKQLFSFWVGFFGH